jgi:hypothetical protein
MEEMVNERLLRVFEDVAAVVPEPEPERVRPALEGGAIGPNDGWGWKEAAG